MFIKGDKSAVTGTIQKDRHNMKSLGILCALSLFTCNLYSVNLSENKLTKTDEEYLIALPEKPVLAEVKAANELGGYLAKITGVKNSIISEENVPSGKSAIYVGQTRFAEKQGVNFKDMDQQDWLIRSSVDGNLILTGGRLKGVLYAVYEFLEGELGCRWLDEKNEIIPEQKGWRITPFERRGRPAFRIRQIYDTLSWYNDSLKFHVRNKGQGYGSPMPPYYTLDLGLGENSFTGSPDQHHTFSAYAATFPTPLEAECFAINSQGERCTSTSGQFCLSNPKTRKLVIKALRRFITEDRKCAVAGNYPPPIIYDISENDNPNSCQCKDCAELTKKDGSAIGPLIDFINYIAEDIRKDYPEIQIRTFAYLTSIEAPRTIHPADNVIINLAQLGCEWGKMHQLDTMRDLSSPGNKAALDVLTSWSKVSKNIAKWDYWVLYGSELDISTPYINIEAIEKNIHLYRENNVHDLFIECESSHNTAFFGLKRYLGLKLLDKPDTPSNIIIDDFFTGMYGVAATPMREYLDYLVLRQSEELKPLGEVASSARKFLDINFFDRALSLLETAESNAKGDQRILSNIRREYVPVLAGLFVRWNSLDFSVSQKKYDFDKLLNRYKSEAEEAIGYYYLKGHTRGDYGKYMNIVNIAMEQFKQIAGNVELPAQFVGKNAIDLPWFYFRNSGNASFGTDLESVNGKTIMTTEEARDITKNGATLFGVYEVNTGHNLCSFNILSKDIPQDEKFHIYKIGKVTFRDYSAYFYGTCSWGIQCTLDRMYDPSKNDAGNTYELYISVKFSGKEYVKDSTLSWGRISIERIIAVPVK